jgi:hypothetical protein
VVPPSASIALRNPGPDATTAINADIGRGAGPSAGYREHHELQFEEDHRISIGVPSAPDVPNVPL